MSKATCICISTGYNRFYNPLVGEIFLFQLTAMDTAAVTAATYPCTNLLVGTGCVCVCVCVCVCERERERERETTRVDLEQS